MTVYAVWKHNAVVTCVNGNSQTQYTADAQGHVSPLDPAPKDGYIFQGWGFDANGPAIEFTQEEFWENTFIFAIWQKLPVVTFDDGSGTLIYNVVDADYHVVAPIVADTDTHYHKWTLNGEVIDVESTVFLQDSMVVLIWIAYIAFVDTTGTSISIRQILTTSGNNVIFMGPDSAGNERSETYDDAKYESGITMSLEYDIDSPDELALSL